MRTRSHTTAPPSTRASADAYGSSEVQAWDDAFVRACGSCRVAATDRVQVLVRAAEAGRARRRTEVAAAGEAQIAVDDAAAFVVLHQASRLVRASGDVDVEIYGAHAGAGRLGPRVRVMRYPQDASLTAELETLCAVRAQFVAEIDRAFDLHARAALTPVVTIAPADAE